MATVHLGRMLGHAGFGKTVAIKQMRSDLVEDEDFVGMFLDEARITSRLDHPNVVMALDVVEEENPHSLFLVMEYVHGGALSAALRVLVRRQEWIPIPVSISMMAGALRGLHAAHEAKTDDGSPLMIIHRDVSPERRWCREDW
jgi:eukaryotic-like serine/threonine-protein kinase